MRITTPETDYARGGQAAQALDPPIGKLWGDGWLVETPIGGVRFGKRTARIDAAGPTA